MLQRSTQCSGITARLTSRPQRIFGTLRHEYLRPGLRVRSSSLNFFTASSLGQPSHFSLRRLPFATALDRNHLLPPDPKPSLLGLRRRVFASRPSLIRARSVILSCLRVLLLPHRCPKVAPQQEPLEAAGAPRSIWRLDFSVHETLPQAPPFGRASARGRPEHL